MYQNPRDPALFHRYFSADASHGPALDTSSSVPPSSSGGTIASSPAAMFLSSFSPRSAAPVLEPDAEGQIVGGFTLGPIIAHGGFSTIRRATSASTGAVVAVKIVARQRQRAAARRIAHEERVWTVLSHEHILPLFAAVHVPTHDFFVTQLCPAGSLFDVVMRGGVPPREDAGRMFRQIVRGLRYLHVEKRLVHRDVKLENVLVDEAGVCRITDFGMARGIDERGEWDELDDEQQDEELPTIGGNSRANVHRAVSLAMPRNTGTLPRRERYPRPDNNTTSTEFQPGSLPYAAPELLGAPPLTSSLSMSGGKSGFMASTHGGAAAVGATSSSTSKSVFISHAEEKEDSPDHMGIAILKSPAHPAPSQDIWALGVLLYALLVGRLPFMDSFEPRLVLKILSGTYTPPPDTNARTLAVLRGCLAARVSDRWNVEKVDEAAWGVGVNVHTSSSSPSSDEEETVKANAKPVVPLDRGRPGAVRTTSSRAERSNSRAPYTASARTSSSRTRRRSESRPARSGSRVARTDSGDSHHSYEYERSHSRSVSPSPRTPPAEAMMSVPVGMGLGIGMGYPSGGIGKGGMMRKGVGVGVGGHQHQRGQSIDNLKRGEDMDISEEGEAEEAELEESLLMAPERILGGLALGGGGEVSARRTGSTPPVAWRGGPGAGAGAVRSRSLSGTGT
ncbi:kinase-like domain-containing protein [Roridomyces roridus]|uniref:Kinase-like domain-containing protein n=1 Tax=Roridomyces roridus TaxID=1738132 RepID=A0AAD7FVC6_9AGAR|nr:kinase-like domain-containing protein [Roridomyces roridus]